MKPLSLMAIGCSAILLTGCATNSAKMANDAEQSIAASTGSEVRWMRNAEQETEVREAIKPLLSKELTADSAVQVALLNNRSLQAEFEEIGIAQAELIQAGLLKNIQFSTSFRFPQGSGVVNTEYSVAGNFLDLIILPLKKKVAARNLEATTWRISDSVLRLAAETKSAFYTQQGREQLLKRLKLIVDVNEAAADVAKRQHDAGNITDLDLANQQAVYTQSRLAVAQTERLIRQDREKLNKLMGLWGEDTHWKVANQLPEIPPAEVSFEQVERRAIEQRLDLGAAQRSLNNIGYGLALRTKTRFLPTSINVGVDAERDTDRSWVVGPTLDLELPIFDQGQGAIARLQAEYRQAQRRLEALAVNIRSEVRAARDELIANRDLAQYYGKVLLPQRIRIMNESLLQYNAMQIGPVELLTVKQQQIEVERDYVETWRDYWIARAELERALGGRLAMDEKASAAPRESQKSAPPQKAEKSPEHEHKP